MTRWRPAGPVIRWGILGCGDVTEVKSGPAFQLATGSELVAVMRRTGHLAQDYARRHGVPFATDDASELIHHPDVDAVYIATPPGSHLELALRVCAAGKPCYVEKPLARSAAESRLMVETFARSHIPLYAGFYRRGLPRFQVARRLLEEGRLGQVTSYYYEYTGPRTPGDGPLPWRLNASEAGAGLFYDLGSHLLDALDYMAGPLADITGSAANIASNVDVEDSVAMVFTIGGVPGLARWNFASNARTDLLRIEGTEASLSMSCFGGDPVTVTAGDNVHEYPSDMPAHVHQGLVQTIVDELLGQGEALSTGETALRTMVAMDTVLAAYYGGRDDEFWLRPQTWPGNRLARVASPPE